jgi:hypothetical protein
MTECNRCNQFDNCTPREKQLQSEGLICYDFIDIDFNCLPYGVAWKEFSYNKYTEDILDYGEESEWDEFVRKEYE